MPWSQPKPYRPLPRPTEEEFWAEVPPGQWASKLSRENDEEDDDLRAHKAMVAIMDDPTLDEDEKSDRVYQILMAQDEAASGTGKRAAA